MHTASWLLHRYANGRLAAVSVADECMFSIEARMQKLVQMLHTSAINPSEHKTVGWNRVSEYKKHFPSCIKNVDLIDKPTVN